MSIFNLKDIEALIDRESEFMENGNKMAHVQQCFQTINEKIISYLQSDYLFHKVFFAGEKKRFFPVNFKEAEKYQDRRVMHFIKLIETTISGSEGVLSITELLLNGKKRGICLYKTETGSKPEETDRFRYFNLHNEGTDTELADYFGEPHETFDPILENYKTVSDKFPSFYVYFIRPMTNFPHYNGALLLIVTRELTSNELFEFSSIWTKILSDTAIIELENEARIQEQNFLFEEHTHTWHTEISSLTQSLDVVKKRHERSMPDENSAVIQQHIDIALRKLQRLRDIVQFNLFLMKTKAYDNQEINALLSATSKEHSLFSRFTRQKINIIDTLKASVETIRLIVESEAVNPSDVNTKVGLLINLEQKLQKEAPLYLDIIETGASIIFNDLLKNAVDHCSDNRPFLDINIQRGTTTEIHLINSGNLNEAVIDIINDDKYESGNHLKNRYGVRTIKRIITSPLFTDASKKWKIRAEKTQPQLTKIILTI